MGKLKLKLNEDENLDLVEDLVTEEIEPEEDEIDSEIFTEPDSNEIDFITSDKLNEIRELLLDIPDDIRLLLLDDKVIILATPQDEENKTQVYCLDSDEEFFNTIELPTELDKILNNESIIKYTEEQEDPRHDKIIELLMQKLEVDEPKEEIPEEKEKEPTEEVEEDIPEEEPTEDEVNDDEQKD